LLNFFICRRWITRQICRLSYTRNLYPISDSKQADKRFRKVQMLYWNNRTLGICSIWNMF